MKRTIAILIALALFCFAAFAENIPNTSRVADASEMTDVQDIVPEGMAPVTAEMLNDGVYDDIAVESSSSMFKVLGCTLTVKGGQMTALLHMKSEAYSYMYPGTAEAASQAAFEDLFPLLALDDGYGFVLPVDALDAGFTCAAFSARKQAWYPRTLLFRADALPLSAWKDAVTAETLGLKDGEYAVDVTLSGAGRTTVASPAILRVVDGMCEADIVFSTARIDYIILDGQKYEPTSTENGAAFTIPVAAFDVGLAVTADSTAITPPVEMACTLTFAAPVE